MADEMAGVPDDVLKAGEAATAQIAELQERRKGRKARASATPAEPAPVTAPDPETGGDPRTPAPTEPTAVEPPEPAGSEPEQSSGIDVSLAPEATADRRSVELADENRRLKRDLSTVHGRLGDVLEKVRMLEERLAEATSRPPAPPPIEADDLTPEEREKFGDDFGKIVGRIADRRAEAKVAALRTQMTAEQTETLRALEGDMIADRYWSEVERLCPGAMSINGDTKRGLRCAAGWGKFLDLPARPGSTLTKRDEAMAAVKSGNALAFVDLVDEFKATKPEVYGSDGTETTRPPRPTIRAQITPRSVRGTPPPIPNPRTRVIPKSEIEKFQLDAQQGKVSVEEADKKMAEYKLALQQGRIDHNS